MKICNRKLFSVIFSIFIITFFCSGQVSALQKGSLEYSDNRFDYSTLNVEELNAKGDIYFEQALQAENKKARERTFRHAMGKYFLSIKADNKNIHALVQMARIYDHLEKDKYAKQSFYKATNIEYNNPFANYYFGEFYFKRRDFERAMAYFLAAYQNGYENNFELNYRLAVIYEKLGDLENSKRFYNTSYEMNPEKAAEYQQKIQQIDSLNYDKSEYYNIIRE